MCYSIVFLLLFLEFYQTESKTYYFSLNKTSNEYIIRTHLNPNISEINYTPRLHLSELRNNVVQRRNSTFNNKTHALLDSEWNYNWQNITRQKIPTYITNYYDTVSKNVVSWTRFLFNHNLHNSTIIKFNLSELNIGHISEIELHFFNKIDKNLMKQSLILRLYQLENFYFNETSLINPDAHKLLNVIYIYQAENGWQVFKLTNALIDWIESKQNLSLFITISKPNEELFSLFKDVNRDAFRTFLFIKSESSKNSFVGINQTDDSCQKFDLNIDFKNLHWDKFIIAPPAYNAFSCSGNCYKSINLSNHLKVTNFYQKKTMCCIPIEYSLLPIMFYDKNGDIVVKTYENMIITACGCR